MTNLQSRGPRGWRSLVRANWMLLKSIQHVANWMSLWLSSAWRGSAWLGLARPVPAWLSSARLHSAHCRSAQPNSARQGSAQLGPQFYCGIFQFCSGLLWTMFRWSKDQKVGAPRRRNAVLDELLRRRQIHLEGGPGAIRGAAARIGSAQPGPAWLGPAGRGVPNDHQI